MAPKAAAGKTKADAKSKAKGEAKKVKKEKTEEEVPKMQEPDAKAHQEALDKIQAQIDELQKEQKKISDGINERVSGKNEYHTERVEIRARLDEVQQKMNAIKEKKDVIAAKLGDTKKESADMKAQLNKMKNNVSYTSEEQIDDRIASLEFKMWTDSISLKEEKALLAEIKELKKTKPKLAELSNLSNKVANIDAGTDLRKQNKELAEQMGTLYNQKVAIQEELKVLQEKRAQQVGDVSGEQGKRDDIQKKVQALIAERSTLKDEFRAQMVEFKAWLAEQRNLRNLKYQEERKAKDAEWKKRQAEKEVEKLDVNPHLAQITLIEQTIAFCKGLLPQDKAEQKEEKKEVAPVFKDGETVLLKKEDREEEYFFAPTKKKAQKKGKAAGDALTKKSIRHNAETFKLFDTLGLEAPITVADVPALLEQLEKQIEVCKEKVDEWEAKKEEMKQQILEGTKYEDLVKGDKVDEEKEEEKEVEEKEEEKGAEEEEKEAGEEKENEEEKE